MLTKPSVISEIWERGDGKQELEKGRGGIERGFMNVMVLVVVVLVGLDGRTCLGISKRFQYESQGPY